jgi:hypothetical protein
LRLLRIAGLLRLRRITRLRRLLRITGLRAITGLLRITRLAITLLSEAGLLRIAGLTVTGLTGAGLLREVGIGLRLFLATHREQRSEHGGSQGESANAKRVNHGDLLERLPCFPITLARAQPRGGGAARMQRDRGHWFRSLRWTSGMLVMNRCEQHFAVVFVPSPALVVVLRARSM